MRAQPVLKTIENIFNSPDEYRVPKFQRSYSWDSDQVQRFWGDVKDVFYNNKSNAYFLGFTLLKRLDKDNDNIREIIDGQQRLATLTIFFACMRDVILDPHSNIIEDTLAIKIQERYLSKSDIGGNREECKIKLNKEDCEFFRCNIQTYGASLKDERFCASRRGRLPRSHGLIKKAYQIIRQGIGEELNLKKDREDKIKFIKELIGLVANRFQVIETEVDDETDAYLIFETLNDRGIELSISDLLKNYLYSRAEKLGNLSEVQDMWDEIVNMLEGHSITNFLRYFWISYSNFVREKELFQALKEHLKEKEDVFEFMRILKQEAESYYYLLEPNNIYWRDVKITDLLKEINTLNVKQVLPLLLSGRSKFEKSDFIKLLNIVLNLSMRYSIICGLNPNKLEQIYSELAILIRHNKLPIIRIRNKFLEINPSDMEFINSFLTKEIKNAELARYVLGKLEGFKNEELFETDELEIKKSITLEHIMPKKPEKNSWLNYDPSLVLRLGNLTLLSRFKNRQASNKSFEFKCKNVYVSSKLKITKSLIKNKNWDEGTIMERQRILAEKANLIWRI